MAAVISHEKPVGIDLERYGRNVEKIGPRFLSAEEWDRWHDSHAHLTMAWTCKEAIYKAMGVPGLAFQPDIQLPQLATNSFEIHVRDKKYRLAWRNLNILPVPSPSSTSQEKQLNPSIQPCNLHLPTSHKP